MDATGTSGSMEVGPAIGFLGSSSPARAVRTEPRAIETASATPHALFRSLLAIPPEASAFSSLSPQCWR